MHRPDGKEKVWERRLPDCFERWSVAEAEVSAQVRDFITKYIHSVWQLELLLLLCSNSEPMNSGQLAKGLYISRETVEKALLGFCNQGLVSLTEHGYVCSPDNSELKDALSQTGKAYNERRSSVINLIFADPSRH